MFLSQVDLAHRVAHRYRQCHARTQDDPHDHAIAWTLPAPFPGIPDDLIIQQSDGCVVTVQDVEAAISKTRTLTRGSCRFQDVHANDGTNKVRFRVWDNDGVRLQGTVTVNIVAREDQLTAFSMIELDGEGALVESGIV